MIRNSDLDGKRWCDLLLTGGVVVTADPERRIFAPGAVAIVADRIAAVGAVDVIEREFRARNRIDARGKVITPGLVNAHLHVSQHLLRGFVPVAVSDNSDYLFKWVFPYYAELTAEEEAIAAQLAGCDLLRKGITTVADGGTVRNTVEVAGGLAATGIRAHIGAWVWDSSDVPDRLAMGLAEALDRLVRAYDELAGFHPNVTPMVSTTGIGLSSDTLLREAKAFADDRHAVLDFHQSFDRAEVHDHRAQHGDASTPVEHLESLGVLGANVRLVHVLEASPAEWRIIRRSGTSVVRCTGTRAAADLAMLIDEGVKLGVGTDSVNVSNTTDILRVVQGFAAHLREPDGDRDTYSVTADDLFDMCTIGGARTLSVDNELGSLEVGKLADLVIFDALRPEWVPLLDPVSQLVLSADGGSVETVIVAGKPVVESGRVVGCDESDLYGRAEAAAGEVLKRMGANPRVQRREPWS